MKTFNSLWAKISLGVVLLIVCVMALVTYVFTLSQIKAQRQELRENTRRVAKQIASIRLAETEGWYVYQDWIDNIIESDLGQDLVYIAIFNEVDSLAAFALNDEMLDLRNRNFLTFEEKTDIITMLSSGQVAEESQRDFDHQVIDIRWGNDTLGKVDVGFSLVKFNDAVRKRLLINLLMLTGFSLLGVIASVLMSHRITRPLNKLANAMSQVAKGNLAQKLDINRRDEIGNLADSFNNMITDLKEKAVIERFSRELRFTFDIETLAGLVTKEIVQAIGVDFGVFFLISKEENGYRARAAASFPQANITGFEYQLQDRCYQGLLEKKDPRPIRLFEFVPHFQEILQSIQKSFGNNELELVSTIATNEAVFGFLILSRKHLNMPFTDKDISFLQTLIGQASLATEKAVLLIELAQQERLKRELEIARQIQRRLLPAASPAIDGLDVSGICIPALEVGGDYYDYFFLRDNKLGIVIADVSGKGTSAAFYMAEIKGMMSSLVHLIESPAQLVCEINKRLGENLDRRLFATMIYAVIDPLKKELTFVRAGHNALLIRRDGPSPEIEMIIPYGLGLGLSNSEVFYANIEEKTIKMNSGDIVLFYTDGISEAMSAGFVEFTEAKLAEVFLNAKITETRLLQEHILSTVQNFVKDAPQHDDITMVLGRML